MRRPLQLFLVSWMDVLAFLDPEPTSKLGLLVGEGAVWALIGGLTAVQILTRNGRGTSRSVWGG